MLPKIWLIFSISLVILLLSMLWWLNAKPTTIETFDYNNDEPMYTTIADEVNMRSQTSLVEYLESVLKPSLLDTIQMKTYNPEVVKQDKTIYVANPNWTGVNSGMKGNADYSLNDISTDILNNNPEQKIKWSKVFIDQTKNRDQSITAVKVPETPRFIINDACNKNGILNSDYKKDICDAYAGDNIALNDKCNKLTAENCKIPSCCVLINGDKCVAGNRNGPIFSTENGVESDYTYYYNKNKCYGNCNKAKKYKSACSHYTKSSTDISKECMIQMFNNYGCPNKNPDYFINDSMVKSYNQTSKQYVDDYIKRSVDVIRETNTAESKKLCYGN